MATADIGIASRDILILSHKADKRNCTSSESKPVRDHDGELDPIATQTGYPIISCPHLRIFT